MTKTLTIALALVLIAAMAFAGGKTEQEEKAEYHYGKFLQAIRGANNKATKGRYGPAPIMRVEGVTP